MKNIITMSFFCFCILLGCSKNSDVNLTNIEKQFLETVPISDMNKSLNVTVDSKEASFALGSDIPLIIKNESREFIGLDIETHARLLVNTGEKWVEIDNAINYSGEPILAPRGTPAFDLQYSWVKPVTDSISLSSKDASIPLRIVIIGDILRGDSPTGKKVAAYVDVLLKP